MSHIQSNGDTDASYPPSNESSSSLRQRPSLQQQQQQQQQQSQCTSLNDETSDRQSIRISYSNGSGKKYGHRRTKSWNQRMRWRKEQRSSEHQNNNVTQSGTQVFLPRMILRNKPYCQSNNQCQVINHHRSNSTSSSSSSSSSTGLYRLLLSDWFHVLLRIPMHYSILMLLTAWLGMILVFALVYIEVDGIYENANCGLGEPPNAIAFGPAFAFSLETCTTVGYGLPGDSNAFFESECHWIQAAIFFQMTWSMLFNAFLFAFFYSQLSKSESRSIQLVFSDKLCINVSNQRVFATVRCYDIDSAFPVVEAHARMYLLDHKLQMNPLRLTNPDDNVGGMLYPSLPQKITHHIDHHSALAPIRADWMPLLTCSKSRSLIPLRSCDTATGDRQEVLCPVCGDTFGTYELLAAHVRYYKMVEKEENYPVKDSHRAFEMPDTRPLTLQEVTDHIEKTMSEIVVVVEGIDPQLSGTFQAIQSYKYEDLVFGADHEQCTSVTKDNKIAVDMNKYHRVRYSHKNANSSTSSTNISSNGHGNKNHTRRHNHNHSHNHNHNHNSIKFNDTSNDDDADDDETPKQKDHMSLSPFSSETDSHQDPLAIPYSLSHFSSGDELVSHREERPVPIAKSSHFSGFHTAKQQQQQQQQQDVNRDACGEHDGLIPARLETGTTRHERNGTLEIDV